MSYLNTILKELAPPTWDKRSKYCGKNYVLIEVAEYSDEYTTVSTLVKQKLILNEIKKIERIQHPFAYGRFLLRKEQLKRNHSIAETYNVFLIVNKNSVSADIKANLDKRRNITEFSRYFNPTHYHIIIAKCLHKSFSSVQRDSEIYPEYLITFS